MAIEQREQRAYEELISIKRGDNIALQARFIRRGKLPNAGHISSEVTPAQLEITPEVYEPIEKLSVIERTSFWKGKEGDDFEQQKEVWAQTAVDIVRKKRAFFEEDEQGKRWAELYGKLGINVFDFDQGSAVSVFDHFFAENRKGKEVHSFVAEVISLDDYNSPERNGIADFKKIKKDLPAYTWLGGMFGSGTAVIASEMLVAEARLEDQKEKERMAKQLNHKDWGIVGKRRLEKLSKFEDALITYTNDTIQSGEIKTQPYLERLLPAPVLSEFPRDLIGRIGYEIENGSSILSFPPSLMAEYLKTITEGDGYSLSDFSAEIENDEMVASGKYQTPQGEVPFKEAHYKNNRAGYSFEETKGPQLTMPDGLDFYHGNLLTPNRVKLKLARLNTILTEKMRVDMQRAGHHMGVHSIQLTGSRVKAKFSKFSVA